MTGKAFKAQLKFKTSAKKEWDDLDSKIREAFRKKLGKIRLSLEALTPVKHKLSGVEKCYKIKLRSDGFRLVYQVIETSEGEYDVVITVITVDRREDVYDALQTKLLKDD